VNGNEFLRRLKKLGKVREVTVHYDPNPGKGSHGRVRYGAASTILKDPKKEIGKGLLAEMCKQLGVDLKDL
jgi:predicted RNA binding protein YcfA (HicA-like mRNA interferase family)